MDPSTRARTSAFLVLCALLASAHSCASAPARADRELPWQVFAYSEEGRPIRMAVIGDPSPDARRVLLLAGVHGSEPSGPPLAESIARELVTLPPASLAGRRIIVIPALNPDGLARGRRKNARGVDLNRDFPTLDAKLPRDGRRAPLASETRALLDLLERHAPARIISIHAPLHCVNFDGPADELAREMARRSGYPLRASIGYPTPGSLGTYAGKERGIPTITLELRKGNDAARDLSETRAALLYALLESEPQGRTEMD